MTRIRHSVRQVTSDIARATAVERLAIVRSVTVLSALASARAKSVSGMSQSHNLFVPNELETHMIVSHNVPPATIAEQRRFCKKLQRNYEEFLDTNHKFMHTSRMNHTHDG